MSFTANEVDMPWVQLPRNLLLRIRHQSWWVDILARRGQPVCSQLGILFLSMSCILIILFWQLLISWCSQWCKLYQNDISISAYWNVKLKVHELIWVVSSLVFFFCLVFCFSNQNYLHIMHFPSSRHLPVWARVRNWSQHYTVILSDSCLK